MTGKPLMTAALCFVLSAAGATQSANPSHVVVMPMANMSKPADLDFQGGGCDIDRTGSAMTCTFQQALVTLVPEDPTTCLITTNRYEQTFKKEDDRRWVSSEGPEGVCGIMTLTTLEEDVRSLATFWRVTVNTKKTVTNTARDAAPACGNFDETPETLMSTDARRPLSCSFIRPGSLEF